MGLADKALLVNLSISQWTGRKYDRKATDTVETSFSTQSKVGNYTKKLLPGATELEEIQHIAGQIRTFLYDQCLPWYNDGTFILKGTNYLDFTKRYRDLKAKFDSAVESFLTEYPRLKEQAKVKLGNLYDERDYPTLSRLRQSFNCSIAFMPIPAVTDFRVEISEEEKQEFLNKMVDVESDAMKECWKRLFDTVSKATERMKDKDAVLRDSLIENIQEICSLLPKLNISDDPQLESMRQEVEKTIAGISTEDCRGSMFARTEAAKALDEVTSKMAAFMGGVGDTSQNVA